MSGADPTPPVDAPRPDPSAHRPSEDGPAYLDAALRAVFASKGEKRLTSPPAGVESQFPGGLGRRYALDSEIARGGMGVIYEVRDNDFGRVLAMKMLRADAKGGAAAGDTPCGVEKRFLEEARLTAQLGHPGVVPVHDLGFDAEGRPFFTMDRVKGRTLGEVFDALRAREAGWNLSRVVGVLVKACQAVAYAHSKSVVHRDLKPTNVMVGNYGEVYVMDWGLAKVLGRAAEESPRETGEAHEARDVAGALATQTTLQSDESPLSLEGSIAGTPAYMSPEQARGATPEVDQLSDVYSIGAILYHLLTGTPPYLDDRDRTPSRTVLERVREGPPPPVHQLAPGAPPELIAICGKAMCREKTGRYATCFELAEDLQAYLDNRVVQAHRTGALAEARAWIRRNRTTALTSALALLALAGAGVAVLVAQWRHNETLSRQVYSYDLSRAVSALNARNTDSLLSLLEGCPVRYRGWEWRRLRHLATFAHQVFSGHQPGTRIRSVAAHPDGTRFASGGEDNTVRIWDLRDGRCLGALWEHTAAIRSLAYGRAGTVLAVGAFDGTVQIFDAGSGAILLRLEQDAPVVCVRFHPDQERLVTADLNGVLKVWRASTGRLLRTLLTDQSRVYDVAISPDGRWLSATTVRGAVRVWEFESGRLVHELHLEAFSLCFQRAPEVKLLWAGVNARLVCLDLQSGALVESINLNKGSVSSISSSSDGSKLVVTDSAARLIDLQRRDSRPLVLVHELGLAYGPGAITPDGETMISATQDGLLCAWKVSGLGQRVIVEPQPQSQPLAKWGVAIHPAGRLIAAACWDGTARLWDLETGRMVRTLTGHRDEIRSLRFGPRGDRLVTACFDSTVKLWDLATGRELRTFSGHVGHVSDAALSPDERLLASAGNDRTVKIWDADTGRVLRTLSGHKADVWWLDFSPDGGTIVSGGVDSTLILWDVASGVAIRVLSGHAAPVDGVAFSPEGKSIASCSYDGTLKLWEPQSGECLHTMRGHSGYIAAFAFTPDGSRILSVADDGELKVWEVETGRELLSLPCAGDTTDIAIAADGETVATVAKSGALTLWETALPKGGSGSTADAHAGR